MNKLELTCTASYLSRSRVRFVFFVLVDARVLRFLLIVVVELVLDFHRAAAQVGRDFIRGLDVYVAVVILFILV